MGGKKKVISYFERQAATYLRRSERGLWKWFRQREFNEVSRLVAPQKDESLIDLGCGVGYYATRFSQSYGMKVLGVDSSPAMLKALPREGVSGLLSEIENIAGVGTYQKALAAGVFEFIAQPNQVFAKCRELVVVGGRLVLLVPRCGFFGGVYKVVHELQGCSVYLRSIAEYEALAGEFDFVLTETAYCTPISTALAFKRKSEADLK